MSRPVRIEYSGGEMRIIGYVDGDTFVSTKRIDRKHMFRGGRKSLEQALSDGTAAWGLDCKACDGMIRAGVKYCIIRSDSGTYKAKLSDFRDKGRVLHIRPHRPQYFLELDEFEKI